MRRRQFLTTCMGLCAGAEATGPATKAAVPGRTKDDWLKMSEDPVRTMIAGKPELDAIMALFPPTTGDPAVDPRVIADNVRRLKTTPAIETGHPFLDLSVKVGLAHIDATFEGDRPKYGVGTYAQDRHDGFPPTIIAAVDALSAWGLNGRAAQLFKYWLARFVRADGTIDYYGASISEYGQLLHTAALLQERAGADGWWNDGFGPLDRIAGLLLRMRAEAGEGDGLIGGVPEADMRKDTGRYFHNNAWAVKGLRRWALVCERLGGAPATPVDRIRNCSDSLEGATLRAIRATWPMDTADWWLSPQVEPIKRPGTLTGKWDTASYTNYRYWPELLASGVLPEDLANRVVGARLSAGGQFCGMTRFADHLDDWPLADYLYGLWSLGRRNDFLLSLYGHVAYHQATGHLTAYEQVTFPPGKRVADYCLPCQLVAARAARLLVG